MPLSTMTFDQWVQLLSAAFLILLAVQTTDQIVATRKKTADFAVSRSGAVVTGLLFWLVPTALIRSIRSFPVQDALTAVWFLLFAASPIIAGCLGRAVQRHREGPQAVKTEGSWLAQHNELISGVMAVTLLASSVMYVASATGIRHGAVTPFQSRTAGTAIAVIGLLTECVLRRWVAVRRKA